MGCVLRHATTSTSSPDRKPAPASVSAAEQTCAAALLAAVASYRARHWPITICGDQIRLSLTHDPIAVLIPTSLATPVARILT